MSNSIVTLTAKPALVKPAAAKPAAAKPAAKKESSSESSGKSQDYVQSYSTYMTGW